MPNDWSFDWENMATREREGLEACLRCLRQPSTHKGPMTKWPHHSRALTHLHLLLLLFNQRGGC